MDGQDLKDFVIYADSSFTLRQNVRIVLGDVGARQSSPGTFPEGVHGYVGPSLDVGWDNESAVFAKSTIFGTGSWFGYAYTDDIVSNDSESWSSGPIGPFPPQMPAFPATTSTTTTGGSGTLSVAMYQTVVVSPSTSYASIDIADWGCIQLEPGMHHIGNITMQHHACITALGPVEVRVSGRISATTAGWIGAAPGASVRTHEIRFEVHGTDDAGTGEVAFSTSDWTDVSATVITPNGTLSLGSWTYNHGFFAGKHVEVGYDAYVTQGDLPPENTPPLIVSSPAVSVDEDAGYAYSASVQDSDAGDAWTWSLPQAPSGMVVGPTSGVVTWTPDNGDVGSHAVTLRVTDASGASDTQSYTLTVTNVNDVPVFATTPNTTALEDAPYAYVAAATDPDPGEVLAYSLPVGPAGMTIDTVTGSVSWTPAQGDVGTHPVRIAVTDLAGATSRRSNACMPVFSSVLTTCTPSAASFVASRYVSQTFSTAA